MINLPDFMIIGAPRSGTSSLFMTLAEHPSVQRPMGKGMENKEPGYFSRPERAALGLDWYEGLFPDRHPGCLIFEGTTSTALYPRTVQRILPHVKAIYLMRNPVKRAWSHFLFKYHYSKQRQPLESIKHSRHESVMGGIYINIIQKWVEYFPKENLLAIISEDWFSDPQKTLKKIYSFLEIDEIYPKEIRRADPWMSEWKLPSAILTKVGFDYIDIPRDIQKWLEDFYRPHNRQLAKYLDRDFEWATKEK